MTSCSAAGRCRSACWMPTCTIGFQVKNGRTNTMKADKETGTECPCADLTGPKRPRGNDRSRYSRQPEQCRPHVRPVEPRRGKPGSCETYEHARYQQRAQEQFAHAKSPSP